MWRVLRRRFAHWLADVFVVVVGWFARRYGMPVLTATVLFALSAVAAHQVGGWADGLGHFIGLIIPGLLLAVSLVVLVWAIQAHAIEPAKPAGTLAWDEEEMAEVLSLPDMDERESA